MSSFASMFNLNKLMQDEGEPDDTMVIDISNISIATLMNNFKPKEQASITIEMIRHLVLDTLRFNVVKFKGEYPEIVIAFDDRNYWRRQKAWYYKKRRQIEHEESEWDWDRLNNFLNPVFEEIRQNMPYLGLKVEFAEADDIIAVVTKKAVGEGRRVLVVSADSDFTQLQKYNGVRQWSPPQKKWVTPKYGSPRNDLRYKNIKGDKKDSIACIKIRNDYIVTKVEGERAPAVKSSELEAWLEADDPTTLMTPEWTARYKENEELRDFEFIPKDIENSIIEAYNTPKSGSKAKMERYFMDNKLSRMFEKLSDF
ncbi:Ribonuclease H [Klebsiella phage vB_KpnM_05F]|nr:Ribonuclease H [Klebsiella phage vB_KpnM_05F]